MHYIYWQHDLQCQSYVPYVKKAHDLGFDAMEMGDYLILWMSEDEVDRLRAASQEYETELTIGLDPPKDAALSSPDAAARERGIRFYADVLPRLAKLGVRCLGGNLLNADPILPYADNYRKELEYGAQSLKQIARRAADYGIHVSMEITNRFENHLVTLVSTGVEVAEMVDEPNFGILLDTFHMNIEEVSIPQAIISAGRHLTHFHLGENNRSLPGQGHLDWKPIMDALHQISYHGILTMEPLVHAQCELGDCCRVWNDLTGFADEQKLDEEAAKAARFIRSFEQGK